MTIRISRAMLQRILADAAKDPAREVCGLLFGRAGAAGIEEDAPARIESVIATANVSTQPADSFEIDPAALFAAIRAERNGGPRLLGHYHSHPNGLATPSARDAMMATSPGRLWLIVAAGEALLWREVPGGSIERAFELVDMPVDMLSGCGEEGCA